MKNILFYVTVMLSILMTGCITESNASNENSYDISMETFTCDSLGVPKTEFTTNEPFCCAARVKNISNKPISYLRVKGDQLYLFDTAIGDTIACSSNEIGLPPNAWGDFVLLPGEELYQLENNGLIYDIYHPGNYVVCISILTLFSENIRIYPNENGRLINIKIKE